MSVWATKNAVATLQTSWHKQEQQKCDLIQKLKNNQIQREQEEKDRIHRQKVEMGKIWQQREEEMRHHLEREEKDRTHRQKMEMEKICHQREGENLIQNSTNCISPISETKEERDRIQKQRDVCGQIYHQREQEKKNQQSRREYQKWRDNIDRMNIAAGAYFQGICVWCGEETAISHGNKVCDNCDNRG